MRDFDEMLQGSFDAHAGEIDRSGGVGDGLKVRAVRDVRSKRAWRAGATGAVASAAVVGVVATAFAFSGGAGVAPAATPSSTATASEAVPWYVSDLSSLGPCTSYVPANGALLPDGMYKGRAYVDPAAGFVVAVTPDGTVTRVQPGPDGDYPFDFGDGPSSQMFPTEYPVVIDYINNSGGGGIWVDADAATWDWTMEPVTDAPAGVNVKGLFAVLTMSLGFGGGEGYSPNAVPDGASAAVVAIYADGREVSGTLVRDQPAPSSEEDIDLNGLSAVAMRVTLADGQVWEIRADYTPDAAPVLPCQPTPPSRTDTPAVGASSAPAVNDPSVSEGPVASEEQAMGAALSGPESAVFQCGMPLPADLQDAADVQAKVARGDVSLGDPDGFPDIFDVGDDGLVVEAEVPLWDVDQDHLTKLPIPGWQSWGLGRASGQFLGHLSLVEVVAVQDGMIVAAAREPVEDWTAGGVGGSTTSYGDTDSVARTQGFTSAYNGIHGLLQPCTGVAPDALGGAQLAVVYGFGPDVDHMTYGWTLVTNE